MRTYELVLILKPSLNSAQRQKIIETVKAWLKNVKITKEDEWGQKPLAYAIKKEVSGSYLDLHFEAEMVADDFEKKLLANKDVLRHLLLREK